MATAATASAKENEKTQIVNPTRPLLQFTPTQQAAWEALMRGASICMSGDWWLGKLILVERLTAYHKQLGIAQRISALPPKQIEHHLYETVKIVILDDFDFDTKMHTAKKWEEYNDSDLGIVTLTAKKWEKYDMAVRKRRKTPSLPFAGLQVIVMIRYMTVDWIKLNGVSLFETNSWKQCNLKPFEIQKTASAAASAAAATN